MAKILDYPFKDTTFFQYLLDVILSEINSSCRSNNLTLSTLTSNTYSYCCIFIQYC